MLAIARHDLQALLIEAARLGANHAINDLVVYNLMDACQQLGISYNTLKTRMAQGKIRAIDGRITGAEIRRYLAQH